MFDTGSTGFMIVCAMLVLLMTPGLAFFYGGLGRRKNVVNTMVMSFAVLGIVGITWTVCGWSFAYGGDGSIPFFGGFDQIGLQGLVANITSEAPEALSHDAYPTMADVVFQLAFCMITTAIITGAVAGRVKFGAVCAFVAVWTWWCTRRSRTWYGAARAASWATPSGPSISRAATWCTSRPASRVSSFA